MTTEAKKTFLFMEGLGLDDVDIEVLRQEVIAELSKDMDKHVKQLIKEHDEGKCICDLTDGGYGLCMAGQYVEGCVAPVDFIENIYA